MDAFHSTLCHMGLEQGCISKLDIIREKDIPILLLWGTEDQICPFSLHQDVLQKLPKAKLVAVESSKHVCLFDDPKKCHDTIISWLQGDKETE